MNLRHLWFSKKTRRFVIALALLLGLGIGCCAFFRISRPADIEAYFGMASECHPVWKRFAFRQFSAGDSAAELLRRFPPNHREEFGRYGIYSYGAPGAFTGFAVFARDGKLLSARTRSCAWSFTFFHSEDAELERQCLAHYKEKHERRERERIERSEKARQDQ